MASQNNIQSFTFSANFEAAQQALGAVIAIDEDLRDRSISSRIASPFISGLTERKRALAKPYVRTSLALIFPRSWPFS